VRGATVRDRPLVVRRAGDAASLASCQIVYVSRSERSRWPSEAKAFDASAVLTVSDIEDFAERGGIIELYLENRRVRFEINRSQAERSGLKIGSELLSLGKIVGPGAED